MKLKTRKKIGKMKQFIYPFSNHNGIQEMQMKRTEEK